MIGLLETRIAPASVFNDTAFDVVTPCIRGEYFMKHFDGPAASTIRVK